MSPKSPPLPRIIFRQERLSELVRRVTDLTIGSLALFFALPIFLIVSTSILMDDRSSILFKQRRVGRYGRLFTIYKFRTMRVEECEDRFKPTSGEDGRLTRVGRILRKTSLDELPQLLNVLKGDMSLVGPRPEMPFVVQRYERWQHLRHLVKPGITGLWQTTCRSTIPLHNPEATKIDLDYISSASLRFDAYILWRTIFALTSARGAV